MIHVGTSGYSYEDWVGVFYPQGLPKPAWLGFYAREFQACEVNFTYYRLPDARTLAIMADKTCEGFLFTIKATQELTHVREDNAQAFRQFVDALSPVIERGKLGCVLAQFPFSFHPGLVEREYLRKVRERMADLRVVIELRNAGWVTDDTFAFLKDTNLGFCCVDEPRLKGLMPPIAVATAPIAYVRFHGRNAAKWWNHEEAWERYDYTYTGEELQEWVPKISQLDRLAEEVFVFCNNHWSGQAVATARQLRLLLQ